MTGETLTSTEENYETRLAPRIDAIRSFIDALNATGADKDPDFISVAVEKARADLDPELQAYKEFQTRIENGELSWQNPSNPILPPKETYKSQRSALRHCLQAIFRGLEVRPTTAIDVARYVVLDQPEFNRSQINQAMHDIGKINNTGHWIVKPEFPKV